MEFKQKLVRIGNDTKPISCLGDNLLFKYCIYFLYY